MIFFLAASVSALLLILTWRMRWVFAKPSIQFIVGANLLLQWPMALFRDRIFEGVESPDRVALAVAVPLLAALAWIPFVAGPTCASIIRRAHRATGHSPMHGPSLRVLGVLWGCSAVILGWYLLYVPLDKTGLFVIITHPVAATLAREDSLKLLNNKLLAYAFLSMANVFAPLIAALSLRSAVRAFQGRRAVLGVAFIVSALLAVAGASLSGARSFPARVLLVAVLALWFDGGMRLRVSRLIAVPVLVMLPVALLTVLREGRTIDVGTVGKYLVTGIRDRVLIVPAEAGLYHIRYAQDHGDFGVAAVPRLAAIAGADPINPANMVGRHFIPDAGPTVTANASFLLTYLSYFGTIGIVLNVLLVSSIEWTMAVLGRTGETLLGPVMATLAVANVGYLSADYSTVLVSNGVLLLAIIAVVGSRAIGDAPGGRGLGGARMRDGSSQAGRYSPGFV